MSFLFISNVMTKTKLAILAFLYCVELVASFIDKLHDIKFAAKFYTLGCGIKKKSVGKSTCLMTGGSDLTSELLRFLCPLFMLAQTINKKAFQ